MLKYTNSPLAHNRLLHSTIFNFFCQQFFYNFSVKIIDKKPLKYYIKRLFSNAKMDNAEAEVTQSGFPLNKLLNEESAVDNG